MSSVIIPKSFSPHEQMSLLETQKAIDIIKLVFIRNLKSALALTRVSAPLFVAEGTGLNDDLNNVERPVAFSIKETGTTAQVVQSLAKWKRYALAKYGFEPGTGLVTDMNAIRRDEEMDSLHSIYVDQWDWEAILPPGCRTRAYLMETAGKIVEAICDTAEELHVIFPSLGKLPSRAVSFITTQELEDLYPHATPQERESLYVREHPTTFLMEIGHKLRSGKPHDGRAPDYDDWTLNGDILMWHPALERAFEVSSMGIRVDAAAMDRQLTLAGCDDRRALPFHKMVLDGTLPLTIGGGIGQSRLCMLLLHKVHIGQVQVSIWDDATLDACRTAGIPLL